MTAKQNVALYFEDGFVITKEEQMLHNIEVKYVQRETRRLIARLVIGIGHRFATIERNKCLTG